MAVNIAIDGTSASGKSTVAKEVAKKLGFYHLNTGSLYRAYALKLLNAKITNPSLEDIEALVEMTDIKVVFDMIGNTSEQFTYLDGKVVDEYLQDNKISELASIISPYKIVRDKVRVIQRDIAKTYNVVMEGRDIGSVILPNADYKFYVTASDEVRATRRYNQLIDAGKSVTFQEVLEALRQRDQYDTTRELCPLVIADDAILIDTSNLTIDGAVDLILSYIIKK